MKKLNENALMQEMNMNEMGSINGGSLLVAGVCALVVAVSVTMCSNNQTEITVGHGTGNHVAVGDSIQNH